MAVKNIPISMLKPGMYVTKLDISWIDSPFMYHHIKVKSASQIDKLLKAGVKNVSIDTIKGLDVEVCKQVVENSKQETSSNTAVGVESQTTEKSVKTSFSDEIKAAKSIKGAVTKLAAEINEALKNDEAVDPKLVSPLIEGTVNSLQRNNHALAALINMQRKEQSLANHAFGTFSLVLSLALKLELTEKEREALGLAAFFHDSGWLKLPHHLIAKKTRYSPSEAKLIQQHVPLGVKLLRSQSNLDDLVLRLIIEHHEYLDGSGFPQRLNAETLHPLSKVFQVAARYDELVHGMNDQPAVTPHGALSLLYKEAKSGVLDEASVTALVSLLSVYPVGSAVLLSSKEKAVVIGTNADAAKQPVVEVYYDSSGTAFGSPKTLNLAKQKNATQVSIMSVLDLNDPSTDPANLLGIVKDE